MKKKWVSMLLMTVTAVSLCGGSVMAAESPSGTDTVSETGMKTETDTDTEEAQTAASLPESDTPAEADPEVLPEKKAADIVFMVDSTSSMSPYINSVKSNLTSFVRYLEEKGVNLRMSVIEYKDITADGEDSTAVHKIDGSQWSSDADKVIEALESISVSGGGDTAETPSDALERVTDSGWQWREDAEKFAFVLTDAGFKDAEKDSRIPDMNAQVQLLRKQGIEVTVVSKMSYEDDYNSLYNITGGEFIDIEADDYYKLMLEVADWIFNSLQDTDGDGIPDEWEINGVDFDGDGTVDLHLEQMGADPNKPDIFVEVDWMYQPKEEEKFLWWDVTKQEEINLAPSQAALKKVYDQFADHNINLHIDAGPDSTDFVTGKKWGELSGGNELAYSENLELGDYYENWNDMAMKNFDQNRWRVFHYCMFVNRYNGSASSGIAENIPGQFFIVSDVSHLGDTAVAGTFMHELGHTLGLCHGGSDHVQYKPNYLSIMNYSFQFSGLLGTNEVNYSEYELPELNESSLNENRGVDPEGLTEGTGLGTKWQYYDDGVFGFLFSGTKDAEGYDIAKKAIDFNQDGKTEDSVAEDLNGDGGKDTLTASVNDWDRLVYKGGLVGGGKGADLTEDTVLISKAADEEPVEELTVTEAAEKGLLGNPGTCAIGEVTPDTVYAGVPGQTISVRINNLYQGTSNPVLKAESELLDKGYSKEISIPGTTGDISGKTVEIPLSGEMKAGAYSVNITLACEDGNDVTYTGDIRVIDPQSIAMKTGESKDLIPDESLKDMGYKWESSNNDVAEIKEGIVTAKAAGEAVIRGHGSNGETVICIVQVTENGAKDPGTDKPTGDVKPQTDPKPSNETENTQQPVKTADSTVSDLVKTGDENPFGTLTIAVAASVAGGITVLTILIVKCARAKKEK